jgi:hypothetical protein
MPDGVLPRGWLRHPPRPTPNLYRDVGLNACWTEGYAAGYQAAFDATNTYDGAEMQSAYANGYRCGHKDRYGKRRGQGATRPGGSP